MKFSANEKYHEALRECTQRCRVYNRLIDEGSMTKAQADRQLALMEEIAADYAKLAEKERLL